MGFHLFTQHFVNLFLAKNELLRLSDIASLKIQQTRINNISKNLLLKATFYWQSQ